MKPGYGFTLVEILITFIVVGFVIGGLLIPFSIQMDYEKIRITQKRLDNIKEALIFFALNHGHLPCPALDSNDGLKPPEFQEDMYVIFMIVQMVIYPGGL